MSSGMYLGFQNLEEQVIATTTCTNTHVRVPSIIDTIGCDVTIDDIQTAKRVLLHEGVDLSMDVNQSQNLRWWDGVYRTVTPLIHFCGLGNLPIVRLLFSIGADCTKLDRNWFPMMSAAEYGHLDLCKWLYEYGGDAKYQINKETRFGFTPLGVSYLAWHYGRDKEGKTCRWLLQNGGGQHLSSEAMHFFSRTDGKEEWNSNLLVLWTGKNIQLHDTFMLLLCGARKGMRHPERSLQILDGHPEIMELIGDCVGLIRGKEIRMLQEFNESVIKYNNSENEE